MPRDCSEPLVSPFQVWPRLLLIHPASLDKVQIPEPRQVTTQPAPSFYYFDRMPLSVKREDFTCRDAPLSSRSHPLAKPRPSRNSFLRRPLSVTPLSMTLPTNISSVQFSRSVVSDSLLPHELQHARPPCPSPTSGVHSDSRPSSP